MIEEIAPKTALGVAGVWGLLIVIVGRVILHWLKDRPALRKIQVEEDSSLRETLLGRVEDLERKIERIHAQHAAERELHAAELAMVRHRLNNESASLDALVGLLEVSANISPDMVKRITESRARAAEMFATEMKTITDARIRIAAAAMPHETAAE